MLLQVFENTIAPYNIGYNIWLHGGQTLYSKELSRIQNQEVHNINDHQHIVLDVPTKQKLYPSHKPLLVPLLKKNFTQNYIYMVKQYGGILVGPFIVSRRHESSSYFLETLNDFQFNTIMHQEFIKPYHNNVP